MSLVAYAPTFAGRWSSRFGIARVEGRRSQRQGKARTIRSRRASIAHTTNIANDLQTVRLNTYRVRIALRCSSVPLWRVDRLVNRRTSMQSGSRKRRFSELVRRPVQAFSYERNKGPPHAESPWSRRITSSRLPIRRPLHRAHAHAHDRACGRSPHPCSRRSVRNGAVSPRRPRPAPAS